MIFLAYFDIRGILRKHWHQRLMEHDMTKLDGRIITSAIFCSYVLFMRAPGLLPSALDKVGSAGWTRARPVVGHRKHTYTQQKIHSLPISVPFLAPFPTHSCSPYQHARARDQIRDRGPSAGHTGDSKRGLEASSQWGACVTTQTRHNHDLEPHSSGKPVGGKSRL